MFKHLLAPLLVLTLMLPVCAQPDLPPERSALGGAETSAFSLQISPSGRFVAVRKTKTEWIEDSPHPDPKGSQIRLWEIATGRLLWTQTSAVNSHLRLLFSPDETRLVCYGSRLLFNGSRVREATSHIDVWDVATGESAFKLELSEGERNGSLVFTGDGKRLLGNTVISAQQAKSEKTSMLTVKEWDASNGKLLRTWNDLPELAESDKWTMAGDTLVTNHYTYRDGQVTGKKIILWSLTDFSQIRALPLGNSLVSQIVVAPDGKRIALKTFDAQNLGLTNEEGYLWNSEDNAPVPLSPPPGAEAGVLAINFSADGQTLIGRGYDRDNAAQHRTVLWFWDARSGVLKETRTLAETSLEEGGLPPQGHLLPDGKSYLLQKSAGKIEVRKLDNHALIRVLE